LFRSKNGTNPFSCGPAQFVHPGFGLPADGLTLYRRIVKDLVHAVFLSIGEAEVACQRFNVLGPFSVPVNGAGGEA